MVTMAPWGLLANLYTVRRNLNRFVHPREFCLTAADLHRFRLRKVGMNPFLANDDQLEDEPPPFQCSAGFLNSFRSRHVFTSDRIHCETRPTGTEEQRQD
jgi:hypothetical protein